MGSLSRPSGQPQPVGGSMPSSRSKFNKTIIIGVVVLIVILTVVILVVLLVPRSSSRSVPFIGGWECRDLRYEDDTSVFSFGSDGQIDAIIGGTSNTIVSGSFSIADTVTEGEFITYRLVTLYDSVRYDGADILGTIIDPEDRWSVSVRPGLDGWMLLRRHVSDTYFTCEKVDYV